MDLKGNIVVDAGFMKPWLEGIGAIFTTSPE